MAEKAQHSQSERNAVAQAVAAENKRIAERREAEQRQARAARRSAKPKG